MRSFQKLIYRHVYVWIAINPSLKVKIAIDEDYYLGGICGTELANIFNKHTSLQVAYLYQSALFALNTVSAMSIAIWPFNI